MTARTRRHPPGDWGRGGRLSRPPRCQVRRDRDSGSDLRRHQGRQRSNVVAGGGLEADLPTLAIMDELGITELRRTLDSQRVDHEDLLSVMPEYVTKHLPKFFIPQLPPHLAVDVEVELRDATDRALTDERATTGRRIGR